MWLSSILQFSALFSHHTETIKGGYTSQLQQVQQHIVSTTPQEFDQEFDPLLINPFWKGKAKQLI